MQPTERKPLPVDHLVYAVPDLRAAVADLKERLGVEPSPGGSHPYGTHNALLSLGGRRYLEIIAPDPAQATAQRDRPLSFGLDDLQTPRLVTWAALASPLEEVLAAARAAGYDPGEEVAGARTRPDGVALRWRSTKRPEALDGWPPPGDGLVPFLIEWGAGTPHPAETSAQGVVLLELSLLHPQPQSVEPMLRALAVELPVAEGPRPEMRARLSTPRGVVVLT